MKKVRILDYGSGNVRSVFNLVQSLGGDVLVSNERARLEEASHLILPGVGAFGAAMEKIRANLPMDLIEDLVLRGGRPFLGICIGMQVLATRGTEFGDHAGLGWIDGCTDRLPVQDLPLPHIGWNNILVRRESPLLASLDDSADFYFVHSFAFRPADPQTIVAEAHYGMDFPCVVQRNNLFGVQFHPEKSQEAGRRLVENFLSIA